MDSPILEAIEDKVREDPDAVCFRDEDAAGRWTACSRAEFWEAVRRLANALHAEGIGRGDRVAIMMRPRSEWEVVDKAALLLGAISVGLDVHASTAELRRCLALTEPRALFVEDDTLVERIASDQLDKVDLCAVVEDASTYDAASAPCAAAVRRPRLSSLLAAHRDAPDARPVAAADDVGVLLFTSGTTGEPKCIPLSHRQLHMPASAMGDIFRAQLGAVNRTLTWIPLSNGTGRMLGSINFCLGVEQYFVRDPLTLFDKVKEVEPTYLVVMPRVLEKVHARLGAAIADAPGHRRALVRAALGLRRATRALQSGGRRTSSVLAPVARRLESATDPLLVAKLRRQVWGDAIRFLVSGSAPVDPGILRFFDRMGVPTYEVYGMSEASILFTMNRPDRQRYGSVGQALPGVDVKLAPDGEVLVKSAGAITGYWEGAGAERASTGSEGLMDAEGYLRSGDLGELREGYLYLKGRKKEIIKTSTGLRIAPMEVERAYADIPGLDSIVVLGNGRRFLCALIALEQGFASDLKDRGMDAPAYVATEIEARAQRLAHNRRIRRFALLDRPFSIEGGELTPTLKPRRARIEQKYEHLVEPLYEREGR